MGTDTLKEEYDMLVFRAVSDLPFGPDDYKRMQELEKVLDNTPKA